VVVSQVLAAYAHYNGRGPAAQISRPGRASSFELGLRSRGVHVLLDDLAHDRIDLALGPAPAELPADVVTAPHSPTSWC
jgi:hypothetical protein